MIQEIRFIVTGEVRKPKQNEWFLNGRNQPICAHEDFHASSHQILKMQVIEGENGRAVPSMGWQRG